MQVQYLILSLDKNSEIQYVKKTYRDRITVYMYGNPSVESLFVLSMVIKYIIWNCILSLAVAIDTEFYFFCIK